MLAFAALMSSCSGDSISELYFVGDSLVAGWDVKSSFPTYLPHNDGVIGAKVEDILTWNLDYRGKDVVMLVVIGLPPMRCVRSLLPIWLLNISRR